ncbi:MAG: cytochrome c3 family protein [Gemmatimonadales bacterium]|jgi:predicted CXXCH cytochrome family protein
MWAERLPRGWRELVARARALSTRARLLVVVAVGAVVVVVPVAAGHDAPVPQPVAFNHRKHTEDLGLDCSFCHTYVRTGAHAGLPDAQTCVMCHSAPQGTSAAAARVTELLQQGDSLRFNKLFAMPEHVFYTHRRHVALGELGCEICHGAIATTERPPPQALVEVTMDFCMDCHREQDQTLECNACHR